MESTPTLMLNNRYRLLSQVAAGGMAVVYKAHDTLLNRVVAVKVLRESFAADPTFQARFQREAQAAANLNHANIVTVYDVGHDLGRYYIVMEYVDGQDLKQIIRAEAPLPIQRAVDITVQICAALGVAHRAGIVHCDVKPQNVLVTEDGRVKVTDFGIARAVSQASSHITDTVWGTPHYISPEQAAGQSPTPASDVYAVGVVMYEMLAGRLPFEGETHTQLALAHMRDEPPPLTSFNPAVPPHIDQIVRKVMSKEPAARYRSADQLAMILVEYRHVADQSTGLQPVARPPIEQTVTRPAIRERSVPEVEQEPEGFDWLGWLLGGLAAIAIIGLIPLWLIVIRAYTVPVPTPNPSPGPAETQPSSLGPTLTLGADQVVVPNLAGMTRDQAFARLAEAGLQAVEGVPRSSADIPAGRVIEHLPPADQLALRNSPVVLILSSGQQVSPVPSVTGLILNEDIEETLKNAGWDVRIEEAYSQKPYREILSLAPPPFTQLAAGEPLTLTISSGITLTLEAQFAGLIELESVLLGNDELRRGDPIDLTFLWRSQRLPNTPYIRFIHFVDPDGIIRAQLDAEPVPPTTAWSRNVLIHDQPLPLLTVPFDAPFGEYKLYVGFYPNGASEQRLPITEPGESEETANERVLIKTVTVVP